MDETVFQDALANPKNLGEMEDADAVGTVGSADCGDMVRLWLKFRDDNGRKVIDRASFQSFGCQTAIAVASMATEMLRGKSVEEAKELSAAELSAPLGSLPPMKIHCGQMVEGALRAALDAEAGEKAVVSDTASPTREPRGPTLSDSLRSAGKQVGGLRIVLQPPK